MRKEKYKKKITELGECRFTIELRDRIEKAKSGDKKRFYLQERIKPKEDRGNHRDRELRIQKASRVEGEIER